MTSTDLHDLSLSLAIVAGGLSVVLHGMAWQARRRLRASLKIQLTEAVEELTQRWEGRAALWHSIGLALSLVSILCVAAWLLLRQ
ncbi:conserved hypothetical protein [Hyphomicrobiales bacterium]|nr:conserved hypothetical protein [Hyphomicrobiales bacterium]CAH1688005.1 conserved hypothetical protein [Hyphomicrobiales bacterium]